MEEDNFLAELESDPAYDPETYVAQIPTGGKEIDSIKKDRNFAYYQLGVIYKEKFKEYQLAASSWLLKPDPSK